MEQPAPPTTRKRVWIVDDDRIALMVGNKILTARGFDVATFSDPARAMQALPEQPPDIIVLDVKMPGMDGFEFCSLLRQNPVWGEVPVLMATIYDLSLRRRKWEKAQDWDCRSFMASSRIICDSEVGVGTTFKIYLPALPASGAPAAAKPEAKPVLRGGTETILVIDDEAHIRNLVRDALTRLGYRVILAGDGESALSHYHAEGNQIRLVVLDLGMPGLGGWECLKQFKSLNPQLPIVITTGYVGENLRERARQEGAVELIAKPYLMESLARSVRQLLDAERC